MRTPNYGPNDQDDGERGGIEALAADIQIHEYKTNISGEGRARSRNDVQMVVEKVQSN